MIRLAIFFWLGVAGFGDALGQVPVVLFDENDSVGADYRDASFGQASGGDALALGGPDGNKMPVHTEHAYRGATSGLIEYRHAGGTWDLFIAREDWTPIDVTPLDTLVLFLNGPAAVPGDELPNVALEDVGNRKTESRPLSEYLDSLDADPDTWQRVAAPITDFVPPAGFEPDRLKTVQFTEGSTTTETRTLWVDYIHFVGTRVPSGPLDAPEGLDTRVGDRSVILHWDAQADSNLAGYRVARATDTGGAFTDLNVLLPDHHFVDFDVENGTSYRYVVEAVNFAGDGFVSEETDPVTPTELTDEAFLDLVQHTAFDFFWYETNPDNGMVRDRTRPSWPGPQPSAASIAAVGFGLSALATGIDHGWVSRADGQERVLTTLRTLWDGPQGPEETGVIGHRGFFYHFLDFDTATRRGTTELSTVDTALLLAGVLHAKAYFASEEETDVQIRALADSIYQRVEWDWVQIRPPLINHGWRPGSGFLAFDWAGYNEAMLVYLLALGSPTHPARGAAWAAWTAPYRWETHYGFSFVPFPPLFGHQYSHVWYDFRGIQDAYMRGRGIDYFENSRRATLANRAYAIDNPLNHAGYSETIWGLTASDGPTGYRARGAPPAQNDDGTITPTAAGGSYAFTPDESLAALRAMYDSYRTELWGPYGFKDAFNPGQNWVATDYLGIDQGPILLMIENGRTGRVWDAFMQLDAVQRGLDRAGFLPSATDAEETPVSVVPALSAAYPNPFRTTTAIPYTLPRPGTATLTVHDVLGRLVVTLVDGLQPAGTHTVRLDGAGLSGGVYVYTFQIEDFRASGRVVLAR